MTTPNNIIDEKDALRVVAQMTIGEIVRGIAALSMSAPVAESPEVKGETPKVRVFTAGPAAMVWRSGLDGDYLINDRFNANATGSVGTCVQNGWDELTPAEVPAWLSDHGYAIDGTREQETPATPIDPDAGKKYGEAVKDLVRFAQDTHVACMKWGKFESGSIEETNLVSEILSAAHSANIAANRVKRLDAAQGGVR